MDADIIDLIRPYILMDEEEDYAQEEEGDEMEDEYLDIAYIMRSTSWNRIRQDWDEHLSKCVHEKSFKRKYRVSHHVFVTW